MTDIFATLAAAAAAGSWAAAFALLGLSFWFLVMFVAFLYFVLR